MRLVATHTIADPSNRPLKLVPEIVLWDCFEGQEELAVDGKPMRICHLGVIGSVSFLVQLGDPTWVKVVVSFAITDYAEQRGLGRIEGCDASDEGTPFDRTYQLHTHF